VFCEAAYLRASVAAKSSASKIPQWGGRAKPLVWKVLPFFCATKAAPTLRASSFTVREPSEKRDIARGGGGVGKMLFGLKSAIVGKEGCEKGRRPVGVVFSGKVLWDHGLSKPAKRSIKRGRELGLRLGKDFQLMRRDPVGGRKVAMSRY
jgi:hypothetical protein